MQRRRHETLFQHQHGLDQTGHARAGFQMADIRLGRTNRQWCAAMARYRLPDRPGLSRVTRLGAGAMRFKRQKAIRLHRGFVHQARQQCRLRIAIGQRNANGAPGCIGASTKQQGADWLPRSLGISKATQNDNPRTFRTHIAIRRRIKHLAASACGEHARAGKTDKGIGREQQIDAPHHRGFQSRIIRQGARGQVQRDKRRRTGGINGLRTAAQIKHMANAVGQDGKRIAGHVKTIGSRGIIQAQLSEIRGRPTDEDRDIAPSQGFRP